LISVIIPVFNRSLMLREAVASVVGQTYRPIELIIIDDGSTDETPVVIEQLREHCQPDFRVLSVAQANAGPGAARNLGLTLATGDYIQYLDSDDLLHPEKFSLQVAALEADPSAGVCYCITLRKDPISGEMVPWARTAETIENIFPSFLPKRGWATLTPLWRRSGCDAIGPWKPYRIMEDWEHDLRAGMNRVRPIGVPVPLCTVRDHGDARASGMNEGLTPARILDMCRAHESVWAIMKERQLFDPAYLYSFSRTMFWLARMCGRHNQIDAAARGLACVDEMDDLGGLRSSTRGFRFAVRLFGWKRTVEAVEVVAAIRRKLTSRRQ
jgi:glycosyltransferase involved in cell wall biosynthesis